MSRVRTIAFVAGGLGLVCFLAGVLVAFTVTPETACSVYCQASSADSLLATVMLLWIIGLLLVIAGTGLLWKQNMDRKKRKPAPANGPTPAPLARRPVAPQGQARLPPAAQTQPATRSGPLNRGPAPPRK